MNCQATEIYLSTQEAVALIGVNKAKIKRRIDVGKIRAEKIKGNGGDQYRILLSSLPQEAQDRWAFEQARQEAERLDNPRDRAERANAERREIQAGRDPGKLELEPLPLTQDEAEEAWARYDRAPKRLKEEAERRNRIGIFSSGCGHRARPSKPPSVKSSASSAFPKARWGAGANGSKASLRTIGFPC